MSFHGLGEFKIYAFDKLECFLGLAFKELNGRLGTKGSYSSNTK